MREPEEGMMKLTFGDWQLYLFFVVGGQPSVGWWESSGGQVWEAHVGEA